jgi:hypothetical protein
VTTPSDTKPAPEALVFGLTGYLDLPGGPSLRSRVASALGGRYRPGLELDLGVMVWVTATTATATATAEYNEAASSLLALIVRDVRDQWIGVDGQTGRRLKTLLAHGWEPPQLHGVCVFTGPADDNGDPTPLPGWFAAWRRSRPQRAIEADRAAFKRLGLHMVAANGIIVAPRPRLRLCHGYNAGIPEDVEDAWGCRAIIGDDFTLDVPADRVSMVGPDADTLVAALDETVGTTWQQKVTRLLQQGQMLPHVDGELIVHLDQRLIIKANTHASHGYVYLCAYFHGLDVVTTI